MKRHKKRPETTPYSISTSLWLGAAPRSLTKYTTIFIVLQITFIETNNVLMWGCSVDSGEGYRVSQAMRESTYPFLALVVLRQSKMMIVGRFEGCVSSSDLVQKLTLVIRDNEAYIVAARAERTERQINQVRKTLRCYDNFGGIFIEDILGMMPLEVW